MHAVKILLILAAAVALYVYIPVLISFNALATGACITAMFYVGLITGELLEFCVDRIKIIRKI